MEARLIVGIVLAATRGVPGRSLLVGLGVAAGAGGPARCPVRQYMSDAFQSELRFVGVDSSPAFVQAPEGNGCAERFIRTLKENRLWVRTFQTGSSSLLLLLLLLLGERRDERHDERRG